MKLFFLAAGNQTRAQGREKCTYTQTILFSIK